MQASVLFSLAVSTDFTVATGREKKTGHMCLKTLLERACHQRGDDGDGGAQGGAKNRTSRETQELVSFQHGSEEEWSESRSFDWSRGIMWRRNAGAVIQTPFRGRKDGRREGGSREGAHAESRWNYCSHLHSC